MVLTNQKKWLIILTGLTTGYLKNTKDGVPICFNNNRISHILINNFISQQFEFMGGK